jgi:hypothetical protein
MQYVCTSDSAFSCSKMPLPCSKKRSLITTNHDMAAADLYIDAYQRQRYIIGMPSLGMQYYVERERASERVNVWYHYICMWLLLGRLSKCRTACSLHALTHACTVPCVPMCSILSVCVTECAVIRSPKVLVDTNPTPLVWRLGPI